MIFGGVSPFLGFYLFFKIWEKNPDSDLGNNIFWLYMVIFAACYYVATHLDLGKNCAGCDSRNLLGKRELFFFARSRSILAGSSRREYIQYNIK